MKKSLLLGLLALALLVIPGVVSAGGSADLSVTGSISTGIDVSVSPTSITYGTMMPLTYYDGYTTVTAIVQSSPNGWSVTAADSGSPYYGYMKIVGNIYSTLKDPIYLRQGYSGSPQALTSPFTNFMSGSSSGPYTQDAYLKQYIRTDDNAGSYTITVTFTGTTN
jgi:hypothetical protein